MTGEQSKRSLGMIVPQLLLFYGRTIVVGSVVSSTGDRNGKWQQQEPKEWRPLI